MVWDGYTRAPADDNGICLASGPDKLIRLDPKSPGKFAVIDGKSCDGFKRQPPVVIR